MPTSYPWSRFLVIVLPPMQNFFFFSNQRNEISTQACYLSRAQGAAEEGSDDWVASALWLLSWFLLPSDLRTSCVCNLLSLMRSSDLRAGGGGETREIYSGWVGPISIVYWSFSILTKRKLGVEKKFVSHMHGSLDAVFAGIWHGVGI